MIEVNARNIGKALALKSAYIGLVLAYLICAIDFYSWDVELTKAIFWIYFSDFKWPVIMGAFGFLKISSFFGEKAGVSILINGKNEFWTGIKTGLLVLIFGGIFGCALSFVMGIIMDKRFDSNTLSLYFFLPLMWIMFFGILPAIIVGFIFGYQVKSKDFVSVK
jgi:hypothetical protein